MLLNSLSLFICRLDNNPVSFWPLWQKLCKNCGRDNALPAFTELWSQGGWVCGCVVPQTHLAPFWMSEKAAVSRSSGYWCSWCARFSPIACTSLCANVIVEILPNCVAAVVHTSANKNFQKDPSSFTANSHLRIHENLSGVTDMWTNYRCRWTAWISYSRKRKGGCFSLWSLSVFWPLPLNLLLGLEPADSAPRKQKLAYVHLFKVSFLLQFPSWL